MLRQFCFISISFPLINLPEQIYEPILNEETLAEFVPLCQPVLLNSTPRINLQMRVRSEIFYSCIFTPSGIFFFLSLTYSSTHCIYSIPLASISPIRSRGLHSTRGTLKYSKALHPWPCLLILDLFCPVQEEEGDDEGALGERKESVYPERGNCLLTCRALFWWLCHAAAESTASEPRNKLYVFATVLPSETNVGHDEIFILSEGKISSLGWLGLTCFDIS